MSIISATVKIALENAVLCRGTHGAKESYEYAGKMEVAIKQAIQEKLSEALKDPSTLEENIRGIINELDN